MIVPSAETGETILVVDDDAATRRLLGIQLRRAGLDVREAESGEAALDLIARETIGLVLLDMHLPGMSGVNVIRHLRERPATATVPIVILTGEGQSYPLAASLGIGADDYLIKPVVMDELVARVRAHLRAERVAAEQALRDSEVFFRTLVEQAADGILVSDRTGRYVEANPAICRMLGYSRDELLAMYTPSLSASDDPLTPADMDERLAETQSGTGLLVERRYRRRDGTSLPAEVNFTQLPDGRLQRTIRDITDRVVAEAALRRSEGDLAEAQQLARIGSWSLDPTTGEATWSLEMYRILGLDPHGSAIGLADISRLFSPASVNRVTAAIERAIATGESWQLDLEATSSDGTPGWVTSIGVAERDAAGRVVKIRGTMQDISERVAADAERARLVSATEQTADAVWMQNVDGNVIYVNPAFTRAYGYQRDEIVGRHASIVDSGRQSEAFFAAIWDTAASGRVWTGRIINRRKDGSLLEVEAVISAIRDSEGRITGYVQADRDVTRERKLEWTLERNARDRETIQTALERIDPAAPPEAIAAVACAEFVRLPGVDSAWVTALSPGNGRILAVVGTGSGGFRPGQVLPESLARRLRVRAEDGPWAQAWDNRPEWAEFGEAISATGLHTAILAPLRGVGGVIGLIGFGAHDPENAAVVVEDLPALATFGSILGALIAPGLEARNRQDDQRALIQALIDNAAFVPFFQPIVDLHTGAIVGYEALSRFADGAPPDARFGAAIRVGLGIELEVATLTAAIETAAAALPSSAYLSLNASSMLIEQGELRRHLAGVERPIVLEITEHAAIDDYQALRRELVALGPRVRLAVDDAGAGYASFRHILELAPDMVKLDMGLVRGIDGDPARQALLAGMAYFAVKRGIRLIAEGIETLAELETLRALAIPYGQGFLLGRPQDGRGPGPWPTSSGLRSLGAAPAPP